MDPVELKTCLSFKFGCKKNEDNAKKTETKKKASVCLKNARYRHTYYK